MIRDPGPIQSLGNGLTSRDVPFQEGETTGTPSNSGYIASALGGHPVMRFFAHTATSLAVMGVLSTVTKRGGLKLAASIQERADAGSQFSTRLVKSITDIRRELDQLQGITRNIDGVDGDAYSRLVLQDADGKYTTGYRSRIGERHGYGYFTQDELNQAGLGLTSEPAAIWSWRDELQQRLVRAGRRLPYDLPALYAGQRIVTDTLFGENQNNTVNWYNPVDVITDFTQQSVKNLATAIVPFEFGGAALSQGRNSLHSLRYTYNDLNALNSVQKSLSKNFVNLENLLKSVGHDAAKVTDHILKRSIQTSGALSAATNSMEKKQGFVQNLRSLYTKSKDDYGNFLASSPSKSKAAFNAASKVFFNNSDDLSFFDLLPGLNGVGKAFSEGRKAFKLTGYGYDATKSAVAFNETLRKMQNSNNVSAFDDLQTAIRQVQSMHGSRLSKTAEHIQELGKGGPGNSAFSTSDFYKDQQQTAAKQLIIQELKHRTSSRNIDEKSITNFVNSLHVKMPSTFDGDTSKIVSIGKTKILSNQDDPSDYFNHIIQRYRQDKGGQDLFNKFNDTGEFVKAFEDSVKSARDIFLNKSYQKGLNNKIEKDWNAFMSNSSITGATLLKAKKAQYSEYTGPLTKAKQDFLQKRSAEALGIPLIQNNGQAVSESLIVQRLAREGFDPSDPMYFQNLRSFLIRNKKMSSGLTTGNTNIFGLQSLTLDEARGENLFQHMPDRTQQALYNLGARMSTGDPVNKSLETRPLGGVYRSSGGVVLDATKVKSTLAGIADFFAGEFKIPILGFNPADLFGYRSFREMAQRSPIQYISGSSIQPFGELRNSKSDFYIWSRTGGFRGTKGRITAFGKNSAGEVFAQQMEGTYRAVPTKSSDMLTRVARFAAGFRGATIDDIRSSLTGDPTSGSRFLDRILTKEGASRFKRAFDIDSEQPNSLFGLMERFAQRRADINNPIVFSELLESGSITARSRGRSRVLSLAEDAQGALSVLDDSGATAYSQNELIRAYNQLRKQVGTGKIDKKIIQAIEEKDPDRFKIRLPGDVGLSFSDINSLQKLEEVANQIVDGRSTIFSELKREGVTDEAMQAVRSSVGEISRTISSASTSTIVGRQEALRNKIFNYATQTAQARKVASGAFGEDFIFINEIVEEMARSGQISKSQKTEAKAAALLSMFNFNAGMQYSIKDSVKTTEAKILQGLRKELNSNPDLARMLEVVSSGELTQPTGLITERFSFALPGLKRKFGIAPYLTDDIVMDPLGTNQDVTLVPTFGTVLERVGGLRAAKSAVGLTTYSDPEAYSGSSVPIAHGIERLNRYFGTVGMQLDVNKYAGPLDLFGRGMIGKRVLPAYAAGLGFMTLDRTAGGIFAGTDASGERIYSPLIMGQVGKAAVETQAFISGAMPGGMTYQEKREQLLEGEVPIRRGRFWPLSNTPFMGEEVMYYSPSWYRRMQGAAGFTSETMGSPIERALYYTDISPLRPFDPYRFERQHYETRPYPVTGEYFTGPFGPMVPLANMTVGKVLKPRKLMHEEELSSGIANYAIAGQAGAYDASAYLGQPFGGQATVYQDPRYARSPAVISRGIVPSGVGPISSYNQSMVQAASQPNFTAGNINIANISAMNQNYIGMAYGPPKVSGIMPPQIVGSGPPIIPTSTSFQAGELGFRSQEMLGIYGFGFGALRSGLGFGEVDFQPQRPVLQQASAGYSSTRDFWNLHLGGLGDVPLSMQGPLGNLEFSEIVRRFIPKERTGIDYINPIQNLMGQQYPFLPGPEYFNDFTRGDPFQSVPRGEIRLPGIGYERMNRLYSDEFGRYGLLDQYKILSDVAPYSQQFKALDRSIDSYMTDPSQRIRLQELRSRLSETTSKYNFSEYSYQNQQEENQSLVPYGNRISRIGELIAHSDNFIVQKFGGKNTAVEHWERKNVYGTSFPQWDNPMESYIEPLVYKATQRNPISAMATLGFVGGVFGRTSRAKIGGAFIGAAIGGSASGYGAIYEAVTDQRFVPKRERERLALEEYADILEYVKQTRLANLAEISGNAFEANQFRSAASRTMYGANIYGRDIETLALSVPKRKREHFMEMLNAPVDQRERILSTSGRLERRLYQAAWGMDVEAKPDLVEYFARHELPDASWEGWHPNTSMESVKIKMGQSMGIDMAQMGYYPQQIKEANLLNPSYPQFGQASRSQDQLQRLRQLLSNMGVSGSITPTYSYSGSSNIQVSAGVF